MVRLLYKLLRYSGLPVLFREWVQKDKVTILMLHDIDPDGAAKCLSYLKKHYNIIALRDFIKAVKNNSQNDLPSKALILTFDDGHKGNFELLTLFKELQIPATIFFFVFIVDTHRHYWFEHDYPAALPKDIKKMDNRSRLEWLEKQGFNITQEYPDRHAIQREEMEAMKEMVDFQAHTIFHPCLPTCDEQEERQEISEGKQILEQNFGCDIYAIAYPNGDYSQRTIELTKEAGYQCAVTVDYGFNTIKSDLFRLKRLSINDTHDMNELIVKSSGLWGFLKTRNGKKNGYSSVYVH